MLKTANALILIFSIVALNQGFAKELYVDHTKGDDSVSHAENSATKPWRSLGRALWGSTDLKNPNPREAASAGDTVIVAAGTYNTNAVTNGRHAPLYNPVNSGREGAPITIRADGEVKLISTDSPGSQPIIGTLQRSYIIWDGFTIDERQVPTRRDTGPVVVWDSRHITLQNLHVIAEPKNWGDNHTGIRIEECDHITVRNNRVHGLYESHGGAILTYRTSNLLVEHNDISDAGSAIFIKGRNNGPVTIRYNRVDNTIYGIMLGQIGYAGEMSYVYQNIVTNSEHGGIIFIGYDRQSPAHVTVANNVVDVASRDSDGGGILLRPEYAGYKNLIFRNNIVTRSAAGVTIWSEEADKLDVDFAHNNYYNNDRDAWIGYRDYLINRWKSVYKQDTKGTLTVSPRYESGSFRLSANSPLREAGIDILDLDGDGDRTDTIPMGVYVTGDETIGLTD